MPIHAPRNLYRGINPHLHSLLQSEPGGWVTFHGPHIADIRVVLNTEVLPDGFYARMEKSLQIEREDLYGSDKTSQTIPDIGIFHAEVSKRREQVNAGPAASPTVSIEAAATLYTNEEELSAIVIYRVGDPDDVPVTRLELLSPSNKPPHAQHEQYLLKRDDTISSGICMVELDYLHEPSSPLNSLAVFRVNSVLPDYPSHQDGVYPFYIAVTNPTIGSFGRTDFYCFHVDDPIPTIQIPLVDEHVAIMDFNYVYQRTYEAERYAHLKVDYEQVPLNFDRYAALDQARIHERLAAIKSGA